MLRTATRNMTGRLAVAGALIATLFAPVAWPARAGATPPPTVLRNTTYSWKGDERIRVTMATPDSAKLEGWFAHLEGDSVLWLRASAGVSPLPIPESRIGRIERSVGTKHHAGTGAAIGLLMGALLGAAMAADEKPESIVIPGLTTVAIDTRPVYPVAGALVGLFLGAAIGYAATTDRWEPVATLP